MVTLSDLQGKAITSGVSWFNSTIPGADNPPFYLAGYAGSGKSTVLPYFIDDAKLDVSDVAFCAPTGKAAKVMTSKLRDVYPNIDPARTIHSLIYKPGAAKAEILELRLKAVQAEFESKMQTHHEDGAKDFRATDEAQRLLSDMELIQTELESAYRDDDKPNFHLNIESEVRYKRLIVVDEASMVGEDIAEDLKKFGIPILAIGDPAQLPPVGDIPGLTVGEPDFFLNEIHRQAQDNPIIRLSMQVREGDIPKHGSYGGKVHIVRPRQDEWTLDMDYDAQVICGTHKKRWKLTKEIRREMGYDTSGPMTDEPLIVCRNSRNIPSLVNGSFVWNLTDVGDLTDGAATFPIEVEDEETGYKHKVRAVQSLFEEHTHRQKNAHTANSKAMFKAKKTAEHLDFGYCITCHKSQGSQWERVIVHDESSVFRDDAIRWAYTAVTRAADELIWVMP